MEENERYNHLNKYLKRKFGERVLKICVDGCFSCPNRDGLKSLNGCLFCSGAGSGEHLRQGESIKNQIESYLNSYKSTRANKFIVYFQAFSNTYAPVKVLQEKYTEALSASNKIVGLDIATRPDCINNEVVNLLAEINRKVPVSVELGLQTANDKTGKILNRCYSAQDFIEATTLLASKNLEVVAHIMVGLPNEKREDIVKTIDFLNALPISGIKIHSTYVLKGTGLEALYNKDLYLPLTMDEYLTELTYILTHLRPDIIIHRLTGDAPKDLLVAPEWSLHKKRVLNGIDKILRENNLYQGIYYNS